MGGKGTEVNKPYHLIKADEKIEEQGKMIQMLQTQREKDYKQLVVNKKMQDKHVQELKAEIERLNKVIEDKDRDLKLQAMKLRELIHDEFRKQTIKKNYEEIERLA